MLSILIPAYNFDLRPLVESLHQQIVKLDDKAEVIVLDDGSLASWKLLNQQIGELPHVSYLELPQNIGRAAIRNRLAEMAQFPYLLFMDGDSGVVRDNYLSVYIDLLRPDRLLYGGRVYADLPPDDSKLFLHWIFGKAREQVPHTKRQKQAWHSFMTNNFVIPKAIFEAIRFDERLLQYGHEDTLFGLQLEQRQIPILHIDNPLEHLGLETAETFLRKTAQATENLAFLAKDYPGIRSRQLNVYQRMKSNAIGKLSFRMLKAIAPALRRNLLSKNPDLTALDLYKLYLLYTAA